jgi:hypothetical protein
MSPKEMKDTRTSYPQKTQPEIRSHTSRCVKREAANLVEYKES